jgi:hypothetical protein
MDGGYTVSSAGERLVDLVPDSFRLFRQYLPATRIHWKKLRFRGVAAVAVAGNAGV